MTLRITRLRDRLGPTWARCARWLQRYDRWLYLLLCGAAILTVACFFYSSLRLQTLYSKLWHDPASFDHTAQQGLLGSWSAPLDDVFIHFDFARATARGYPFEWLEGNGYSSGGTSLAYPFVLALGYWIGFRSLNLMVWAGIVACVSVLGLLIATQRMFEGLPRWTAYLTPVFLLGTGVLNWTLFSGMEVALFLGIWGAALVAWDDILRCDSRAEVRSRALLLGAACLLLVATRPEAALSVAIFSLSASYVALRRWGKVSGLTCLLCAALPGACVVVGQAIANRILTGDFTAAGALAKLEMHHPYLTPTQVWNAWLFHISYQVRRVTEYHLSIVPWLGWILWVFAGLGVVFRRTRRYALLLLASATAWVLVVALNGQVRWQNERYTMPALAWLLLAAALGFSGALTHNYKKLSTRVAGSLASIAALLSFAHYQAPRFKDQVWFFGRASRNILDQHVATGMRLRHEMRPRPSRILLSDAGAIPYAADMPAVDLIGLGGYHRLPFARATRLGAAGGIELIERLPHNLRPDTFALYPSWWHTLPLWFGRRIDEVPVRGNVICGGASKVLYRADWSPLDNSGQPFALDGSGQRVVDSVDFGDVLSERAHEFQLERKATGHLTMKLLADPRDPARDLWDGGRLLSPGAGASLGLTGLTPNKEATLWFRVAPAQHAVLDLHVGDVKASSLQLEPSDEWRELPLTLPAKYVTSRVSVRLNPSQGGLAVYHVWLTQRH